MVFPQLWVVLTCIQIGTQPILKGTHRRFPELSVPLPLPVFHPGKFWLSPTLWFLFPYLHESTGVCFPSLYWGLETATRHKSRVIIELPFFSLLRYHTQSYVDWCLENHCLIYFVQFSSYLRQGSKSDICYSILTKAGSLFESSWLEPLTKGVRDSINNQLLTSSNFWVSLAYFCWNIY